jgi:hypothetical protein
MHGPARVGRWRWTASGGNARPSEVRTTAVLRPGRPTAQFTAVGPFDTAAADTLEVFVDVTPGADVTLTLHRAAVVR